MYGIDKHQQVYANTARELALMETYYTSTPNNSSVPWVSKADVGGAF